MSAKLSKDEFLRLNLLKLETLLTLDNFDSILEILELD